MAESNTASTAEATDSIGEIHVSELDLNAKTKYENLKTLSSSGMASFLVSIVNALIVYFTLRSVAEPIVLNIWFAFMIVITVLRAVMVLIFWQISIGSPRMELWTAIYFIFIYSSGLAWGILPLLNVFYLTGWTETFIVFVVSGMSAGGLVALYSSLYASIPYLLLILLPLIYALGSSGAPAHTAMAVLASMYLLTLVRSSYALNAAASNTIRLEMENSELFKFLLKAKR